MSSYYTFHLFRMESDFQGKCLLGAYLQISMKVNNQSDKKTIFLKPKAFRLVLGLIKRFTFFLADEITASFRRFGPLVVDWPHKVGSKLVFCICPSQYFKGMKDRSVVFNIYSRYKLIVWCFMFLPAGWKQKLLPSQRLRFSSLPGDFKHFIHKSSFICMYLFWYISA